MLRPVYGRFIADVLDQATAWPESIGVVLPLPTELLHDDEVVHEVHAALQRYGLAPARLTIDVHEAALSKVETRVVLANLRQRKIGIRVSGVGEGGLPLALLGNLPIDEVAFTRSLLGKSPPLAMRTLLFELFRRAGYRLVATDIRDEKLISRLKDRGSHAVQGPAMGAAPTAESFATWLQRKA